MACYGSTYPRHLFVSMNEQPQATRQRMSNPAQPESADLIFVVGNSRSGTTMMARALDRHPSIFAFKELHFFEELWDPTSEPSQLAHEEAIALVSNLIAIQRHNYYEPGEPASYTAEAQTIVESLSSLTPPALFHGFLVSEAALHGKSIACLQTPRNLYYLSEILAHFPRAYVLIMIRDPRAVLLSQKKKWRGKRTGERRFPLRQIVRTWANYHPLTISLLWRSGIEAGRRYADHPRVKEIIFETLTEQPEQLLKDICSFAHLAYDREMLEVPQVNSSNRANQHGKSGFDPWIAQRWRQGGLLDGEIRICQLVNKDAMVRYGYVPLTPRLRLLQLFAYGLTFGLKLALAFLLNVNRMRNLGPALKRRLNR